MSDCLLKDHALCMTTSSHAPGVIVYRCLRCLYTLRVTDTEHLWPIHGAEGLHLVRR